MAGTLIETIRGRIEAIRGQRTRRQELDIVKRARERIESIRAGEGGIVERLGERFPALKRVRGQLEPWQRPALFERGMKQMLGETRKQEIAGGREMKPPWEPAIF